MNAPGTPYAVPAKKNIQGGVGRCCVTGGELRMHAMPPASPFATGDELVHLEKGLARVTEIEHSAGTLHLVVAIGKQTVWIPLDAWREHVRALPTRKEAEQWRTRAMTGPITPGGAAIARRRETTVRHRDFDQSSPRSRMRIAPAIGRATPITRAEAQTTSCRSSRARSDVRSKRCATSCAPRCPMHLPRRNLRRYRISARGSSRSARAMLGATTVAGDPGSHEVELATLPGEWLGYRWIAHARDEFGRLVAVHADHVGNLAALLAARMHAGTPNCDAASALVYDLRSRMTRQRSTRSTIPSSPG